MSEFTTRYRTHTCGELRPAHLAKPKSGAAKEGVPLDDMDVAVPRSALAQASITLCGHVDAKVDDRSVLLRDRYGKTLITVDPAALPYVEERFSKLDLEDVIQVGGEVALREKKEETLATGEVFLRATKIELLSKAEPVPEGVLTEKEVPLDDRLAYRQLYLRRPEMKERLAFRAKLANEMREYLLSQQFLELETPQLFWYDKVAIAPEPVPVPGGGAFALPSGPVVLDQYVLASGIDRMFQMTRVTRRERDPSPMHAQEHTSFDINMCYVDLPDFMNFMDGLLAHVWKNVLAQALEPVKRLTFDEAMLRYGTDRVDARFGLELADAPDAAPQGGVARFFRAPKVADAFSDSELDRICAESAGQAELRWARFPAAGGATRGSAAPLFVTKPLLQKTLGAGAGDAVVLATASTADVAGAAAGRARLALGRALGLIDEKKHVPVWVHSYPFMEDEDGHLVPRVVVFSQALQEDKHLLFNEWNRDKVRSKTFDLIVDGMEIASGYIGHHMMKDQFHVWDILFQMSTPDLVRVRAPVESHRYGVAPHGGLNIGFDRLVARLCGLASLDEGMHFPKSADCKDPMLEAPGKVAAGTVADLVAAGPPKGAQTEEQLAEEVMKA